MTCNWIVPVMPPLISVEPDSRYDAHMIVKGKPRSKKLTLMLELLFVIHCSPVLQVNAMRTGPTTASS